MKKFKIITSGDKSYFKFLWRFENNVFRRFGEYPIIYDLGLTDSQKSKLKSKILKTDVPTSFSGHTSEGFIKAIHKPACVFDFLKRNSSNCLFLDADILFRRNIKDTDFLMDDFDIGITPRHPIEQNEKLFENGFLNSGVIYFSNNQSTLNFVNLWIEECEKENTSDQLALSNLISFSKNSFFKLDRVNTNGVKVKLLDPKKYNDVSLTKGLILHYKNAGRYGGAYKRYVNEYNILQIFAPIRIGYLYHVMIKKIFNKILKYLKALVVFA
jgi:hypothetical protein